jgi:hypothetical protein
MSLYKFLHNLLNVLVQIAKKKGDYKKIVHRAYKDCWLYGYHVLKAVAA